jgi:hypothetical protein
LQGTKISLLFGHSAGSALMPITRIITLTFPRYLDDVADLFRVPRLLLNAMHIIETTDLKEARRARLAQFQGHKATLTGSTVTGVCPFRETGCNEHAAALDDYRCGQAGRRSLANLASDQFPKQWLFRPISIAAASCRRVVGGFDNTAETASHFVGAFSRSPAHPVSIQASRMTMILIRLP